MPVDEIRPTNDKRLADNKTTEAAVSEQDLPYLGIQNIRGLFSSGALAPTELLEVTLDRVKQRNSEINAVVALDAERARAEAVAADQAWAEARRLGPDSDRDGPDSSRVGPLTGIPITIKDSMMVEGMVVTSGAEEYADYVAPHDADSVRALRDAGAVVYGKTNLPIWAGDVQTFNDLHGTTNNPWDLTRTPGGSSGGAAAALAAGFTSMEIGSDIAGSIRNPASLSGVVGHKPSYGLVSGRGQIPGPPGTFTQADIAVVGPMARSVADARQGLELMVGPDDWMANAWSVALPPARQALAALDPAGLRVAVLATDPACPVDPEIEAAILSTAAQLELAGATVDIDARPERFDFGKAHDTFLNLLGAAMAGGLTRDEIEALARRLEVGETPEGGLGIEGAALRHRDWLTNNERRLQMRDRWRRFFEHWDVVLAPVAPTVAPRHDHSHPMTSRTIEVVGQARPYTDLMAWMGVFGVVWLPATAVPIGTHSSGLPLGCQVVGPFLEDLTCLGAAEVIEALPDHGFRRPPGW